MFDAKSLLEVLVNGAAPKAAPQSGGGGLGDLLGKMMQGGGGQGAPSAGGGGLEDLLRNALGGGQGSAPAPHAAPQGQGMGLEDLLRNALGGGGGAQAPAPQAAPSAGGGGLEDLLRNMLPGGSGGAPAAGGSGGGLGDILGQLQKGAGQGAGGLVDILGQVFGQATQGVKEGAGRLNEMTGAGDKMRDALGQATGKSPDDLMKQLQDLIANNQMAAGAGLGGLGALVLGTKTGRSVATGAVKLGALALIGGLAYTAYQNYAAGRPVLGSSFTPQAAPKGSGFEPQAITNESAALYLRAMIAAAAADGRIDAAEQQKILGGLKQAGLEAAAEEFLAQELNNPASAAQIAAGVSTPEDAVQVYTAARIAIEPDTRGETRFLAELASALGINDELAAHIDGATRGASA